MVLFYQLTLNVEIKSVAIFFILSSYVYCTNTICLVLTHNNSPLCYTEDYAILSIIEGFTILSHNSLSTIDINQLPLSDIPSSTVDHMRYMMIERDDYDKAMTITTDGDDIVTNGVSTSSSMEQSIDES